MKPTAEFKVVILDKITDPAKPMRDDLTPESVKDLADSIRQLGLIEPLVVKPAGDSFEVIAGHRRLLAAELADLVEVPCYIVRVSDETADLMKIHENLQRKDISPIEEGKYFEYLVATYGWTAEKIAGMIGRSDAYVYARMSIGEYPEDIHAALENNRITIGVARELAQIDNDESRIQYLDYAIRNGITTIVAEQWKREYKAGKSQPPTGGNLAPEVPQNTQPVTPTVTCPLCAGDVKMREAKMIYVHTDCLMKI